MTTSSDVIVKLVRPAIVLGIAALLGGVLATTLYHNQTRDEGKRAANTAAEQAEVYKGCMHVTPLSSLMTCVAEGTKAAYDQKHTNADLHAQQEVAAWTFGMFVFGVMSFITSGLALAALVWTFREQRKLTQGESRAYLRIGRGSVSVNPMWGLVYSLLIKNHGKTPASRIEFSGHVEIRRQKPGAARGVAEIESVPIGFRLDEIPAETVTRGDAPAHDILDLPEGLKVSQGSFYKRTGMIVGTGDPEEDGVEEKISVLGTLSYFDVFGDQHTIDLDQWSHSLDDDSFLRGTGRSETFSDYE